MYIQRHHESRNTNKKRGHPRNPIFTKNTRTKPQKERIITKTNNKTKMVAMRFCQSDYDAIYKKATKANMNFTEFVTASAMNKSVNVINGLDEVFKEQKHIGRNINQLTTLCNMGKITCPDLTEIKIQFADIITKLDEIARRYG